MEKVVAIHQPNFFPWLGYFDKIYKSDTFILLDNVQFSKTGGTWTNRVKIVINNHSQWLTLPVVRNYHGLHLVKDMEIDNASRWRVKMVKTIEQNYKKCPFFDEGWEYIQSLIDYDSNNLCDFNINAITSLTNYLGLDVSKLVIGSTLKAQGKATDLLITLTQAVAGSAYMCGGGASSYQEDDKFALAGVQLIHQDFSHPAYPQANTREFISGLSIIDALFNCGRKAVHALLETNKQKWPAAKSHKP